MQTAKVGCFFFYLGIKLSNETKTGAPFNVYFGHYLIFIYAASAVIANLSS